MVLGGVVLISGVVGTGAYGTNPGLGVMLGLVVGLVYAAFLLVLRHGNADLRRPAGPLFDATLIGALASLVIGLPLGEVDLVPELPAHGWLLILALTSQVVGWLIISVSLPRLPAALTSVILTLQPVASVMLAMLLLGEAPSGVQLAGRRHDPGRPAAGHAAPPRRAAARAGRRAGDRLAAMVGPMSDAPLLLTGSGRLLLPEPYDGPMPWAIAIRDGRFAWVGARSDAPPGEAVDLGSALVTPGLVDAHTHPAFLGDRSDEAAARLAGAPYTGGGILRTVAATRAGSDDELRDAILGRLRASLAGGTTTIECKSGYGLSTAEELRALRLIGEAAAQLPIRVVRTFLGAHAVPPEAASMDAYVATVADEMLPAVAADGAAEFCDVFCDARLLLARRRPSGSCEPAAGLGLGDPDARRPADAHPAAPSWRCGWESAAPTISSSSTQAGVAALAGSRTVATLLPGPALVMRGGLPPARALLDAGATVALASDANAGTFGAWGAMPLVIGLGATLLGMTVAEAVTAATPAGRPRSVSPAGVARSRIGADADLVAWDAEHEGAFALSLGNVRPLRDLDRRGRRLMDRFDLVIIGAGPAGEAAAFMGARPRRIGRHRRPRPLRRRLPVLRVHALEVAAPFGRGARRGRRLPVAEGLGAPRLHDQPRGDRLPRRLAPLHRPRRRPARCRCAAPPASTGRDACS